jgi:hypothetical protein
MKRQKWIVVIVALGLMGGAAGLLTRLQANQKLGRPAVKTEPIPGSQRLEVVLPERVLDYTSEEIPVDKATLEWLPQDTSFGQRLYRASDGFPTAVTVVLMGSDRTSLHKTEFCLEGQGWKIDRSASGVAQVQMERPCRYELPVMKFIATHEVSGEAQKPLTRGVYVVWFVADDNEYTARHWQRMWWMARDLLCTGVLQRWASISFFAQCAPGGEDAAFERIKTLMRALVPEFQLVPQPTGAGAASAPSHSP